ncbi:MAG: phospholipase D-like domain-containing protein, partial [Candidatus Omnitrophota bacterium]
LICLITIESFLVSIVTQASPEYPPEAISPPSRFSSSPRIIGTEKGFCVVQDQGVVIEEYKREAVFACMNFLIGRALYSNQGIVELREALKLYVPRQLHIESIAKNEGLYVTYRKSSRDPPIILHYFLHKENSHIIDNYVSLPQKTGNDLLIEPLDKMLYQKIKDDAKVFFSPEGGCEEELVRAIDSSEKTIDAAVYSFTNTKIRDALKRAKERGVVIRLFLNGKRASNKLGKELESYGVKVKYYDKRGSLMHNKFMIIDEENIYSGSYNWTILAEKDNRENLIILPYLEEFRYEFDYLWSDKERPPPKEHSPPPIKVLFSPKGGCENELIELIEKVKNEKKSNLEIPRSIKIALYYFTNKDIAKALFDAKENGVDVEIILDKTQKKPSYAIERYFHDLQEESCGGGGHLYIKYCRIPKGMMHNKFAIIGDATVTGSYNWTKAAENKNRENLIVLPAAMKDYREEFDRIMEDAGEKFTIDEDRYSANRPRGPPIPDSAELPQGVIYEGVLVRGVPVKYIDNIWTITDHDVQSESSRYTPEGVGGIYAGGNWDTTFAELARYGYSLSKTRFGVETFRLSNMLDLTDPNTLNALAEIGIKAGDLTQESKVNTQLLGEFVYRKGYHGIIAPSARYAGTPDIPGKVIVLFQGAIEEIRLQQNIWRR